MDARASGRLRSSRAATTLSPTCRWSLQNKEKYVFIFDAPTSTRAGPARLRGDRLPTSTTENHLEAAAGRGRTLSACDCASSPTACRPTRSHAAAAARHPRGRVARLQEPRRLPRLAGGRDMAGNTSCPARRARYAGGAYSTTWEKALRTLGSTFAAGVNQTVFHGFPYADAPGVAWPGFAAFSPVQRRRLRRGVGPAPADLAARRGHRRLPRPHPAGAADRHRHAPTWRVLSGRRATPPTGTAAPPFTADGVPARLDPRVHQRPACSTCPIATVAAAAARARRAERQGARSRGRRRLLRRAPTLSRRRRPRSCSTGPRPGCRS